jgi:hypothetical protein
MPAPTRRVILLGASNVTRSFATIVETVRHMWREPVELMVAMGHGRSYGQPSTVFGRKISGIFSCALWQELERRGPLPTVAFMTDIGNDLLYETSVDRLLEWVEGCHDRLETAGASILVSQLPLGSLARLGEARYRFFRRLLFPRSRLTLSAALAAAAETNRRLVALGEREKTTVISASNAWYGLDPIHLKRGAFREAWPTLMSSWCGDEMRQIAPRPTLWSRAYLTCLAPHEQSIFGVRTHCVQPCGCLFDGTTISLY